MGPGSTGHGIGAYQTNLWWPFLYLKSDSPLFFWYPHAKLDLPIMMSNQSTTRTANHPWGKCTWIANQGWKEIDPQPQWSNKNLRTSLSESKNKCTSISERKQLYNRAVAQEPENIHEEVEQVHFIPWQEATTMGQSDYTMRTSMSEPQL